MDYSVYFGTVIKAIYSLPIIYLITKFSIWLVGYIKLVYILHKIPSPAMMMPFIGNAHQV